MKMKIMLRHFLVPFDGTPFAEGVLTHTIAFARVFEAQVTLLCVLAHPYSATLVAAFDWQMRKAEAEATLKDVTGQLQEAGVPTRVVKITGQSASSVIQYTYAHQVDLVILGTRSESKMMEEKFGRVLQTMLLRSGIPTLLVHPAQPDQTEQTERRYQRLFAPLAEVSHAADRLPFVTTLAHVYGTRLLLLHVLCQPQRKHHTPSSPPDKAIAKQVLACKYEAVASHLGHLELPFTETAATCRPESEAVAACLHQLAEVEGVELVILSVDPYTVGSQWPHGTGIPNFIAYGTAPLLVMQVRSGNRAPTLAIDSWLERWGPLFIANEQLTLTWLYD